MQEIQGCLKNMTMLSHVDNYVETVDYSKINQNNEKCVIFQNERNARKFEGKIFEKKRKK
jgi:hypothetical protein